MIDCNTDRVFATITLYERVAWSPYFEFSDDILSEAF